MDDGRERPGGAERAKNNLLTTDEFYYYKMQDACPHSCTIPRFQEWCKNNPSLALDALRFRENELISFPAKMAAWESVVP